ncbi:hypothetical protein ACHAWF_010718, partial [Thalassiosira exigua]
MLTRILKDYFMVKTARMSIIATLSTESGSMDHTENKLRYAEWIKESKVGDVLSLSNQSRGWITVAGVDAAKTSCARAMRPFDDALAVLDENDEYNEDSFESIKELGELGELFGDEDKDGAVDLTVEANDRPDDKNDDLRSLMEVNRTVRALLDGEEAPINLHMCSIQENAKLLTNEGALLRGVQEEGGDVDACIHAH